MNDHVHARHDGQGAHRAVEGEEALHVSLRDVLLQFWQQVPFPHEVHMHGLSAPDEQLYGMDEGEWIFLVDEPAHEANMGPFDFWLLRAIGRLPHCGEIDSVEDARKTLVGKAETLSILQLVL